MTFPFRRIGKWKKVWDAIPVFHKDEVSYRRRGGYFGWTPVVSPEMYELLKTFYSSDL
jgi:hypothetical protein